MTKFHINKNGVPAPCKAKTGNCPLGGSETHFNTSQEAQDYVDAQSAVEYGILGVNPVDEDDFEEVGIIPEGGWTTSPELNAQMQRMIDESSGKQELAYDIINGVDKDEVDEFCEHIAKVWDIEDYIDMHYSSHSNYDKFSQVMGYIGDNGTLLSLSSYFGEPRIQKILDNVEKDRKEDSIVSPRTSYGNQGISQILDQTAMFDKMEYLIDHSDTDTVLSGVHKYMPSDEVTRFNGDFAAMRDVEYLLDNNDENAVFTKLVEDYGSDEVMRELSVWLPTDKLQEYLEDFEDGI